MPKNEVVKGIENIILNKELTPTVCEDSGLVEWSVGEAQKLAQAIYDSIVLDEGKIEKILNETIGKYITFHGASWKILAYTIAQSKPIKIKEK